MEIVVNGACTYFLSLQEEVDTTAQDDDTGSSQKEDEPTTTFVVEDIQQQSWMIMLFSLCVFVSSLESLLFVSPLIILINGFDHIFIQVQ